MRPDETDEERKEKLDQDIERPFTPADPEQTQGDTLPTTDTEVDTTELYQEGVDDPDESAENGIAGYDPESDQRRHTENS